jgi:hypothetical protein
MRTTIDIDNDVLMAAKSIARTRHITIGRLISELARTALTKRDTAAVERDGVPLFPVKPDSGVVTPEIVNLLRDEMP